MTKAEWLHGARTHRTVLVSLITACHPVFLKHPDLPITAPRAADAAAVICEDIRAHAPLVNPVELFDRALAANDLEAVARILNEAWFGVPESTGAWQIVGFKEAVSLLEDLPERDA